MYYSANTNFAYYDFFQVPKIVLNQYSVSKLKYIFIIYFLYFLGKEIFCCVSKGLESYNGGSSGINTHTFEIGADYSGAASGWALAHPEFGSSVNPTTTRGADYTHHITASPPRFENPAASLALDLGYI